MSKLKNRINNEIRAKELRVVTADGENLGVISLQEALKRARESELDLIEISPEANPPVAKIMDFGKYQYELKKRLQEQKKKAHQVEVKTLQVKIGTGEHDLELKAKKASAWLSEGHRIKLDLFLPGRAKYLDRNFLQERMERMLKFISVEYKVAQSPQKSPKGLTIILEKK
ncbi:MAG: translation initiation factor IF-3 [Candidatus Paceibacterota bacterium]